MGKSYHSETAKFAISLGRGKAKIARHSHLITPCSCLAMEASVRTGGNPARLAELAELATNAYSPLFYLLTLGDL